MVLQKFSIDTDLQHSSRAYINVYNTDKHVTKPRKDNYSTNSCSTREAMEVKCVGTEYEHTRTQETRNMRGLGSGRCCVH